MAKRKMPSTYTTADVIEFLQESEEWCGKICKVFVYDEDECHVHSIKSMEVEGGVVFLSVSQFEEGDLV